MKMKCYFRAASTRQREIIANNVLSGIMAMRQPVHQMTA